MKLTILVFIILTFNIYTHAQNSRNYLGSLYDYGIAHYLTPDSSYFKRELSYITKPSFISPEYSIALETKENKPVVILRSFKSNYWELVFSKRGTNQNLVESSIDSSYVFVSNAFANKLKSYFEIVLQNDTIFNSRELQVYDGTVYLLKSHKTKREVRENDFATHKNYYNLIVMFDVIANDLKQRTFKESFYLDQIDKTGLLKN